MTQERPRQESPRDPQSQLSWDRSKSLHKTYTGLDIARKLVLAIREYDIVDGEDPVSRREHDIHVRTLTTFAFTLAGRPFEIEVENMLQRLREKEANLPEEG